MNYKIEIALVEPRGRRHSVMIEASTADILSARQMSDSLARAIQRCARAIEAREKEEGN